MSFALSAHADMVPASKLDAEPQSAYERIEFQHANLSSLSNSTSICDLDFRSVNFLPKADMEVGHTTGMKPSIDLTGGPGSIRLCLYALMGLGLCSAPHWIKKLHIGHIPEWYHNGGPFQIGHSLAVSPESLCSVLVYCFVQPVLAAEHFIPQYRLRTVVALWRETQFTLDVIASRGPPST
jgi:hypothetical protein